MNGACGMSLTGITTAISPGRVSGLSAMTAPIGRSSESKLSATCGLQTVPLLAGRGGQPGDCQLSLQGSKSSTVGQCLRQGCQSGGKRKLRRISVGKLEPFESAHVNEARLRSVTS